MPAESEGHSVLPEIRAQLDSVHAQFLNVHRALLDREKANYEKIHGPVKEPMEVLNLALKNPAFAWLREMSAFIVEIDELVSRRNRPQPGAGEALLKRARELLTPVENASGFQGKYFQALQDEPAVLAAHVAWKRSQGIALV